MKIRKISELLQLLIDNHEKYFFSSLCYMTYVLKVKDIINNEEKDIIDEYIHIYAPLRKYSLYRWPKCEWPLREQWLKERIQIELSNNN